MARPPRSSPHQPGGHACRPRPDWTLVLRRQPARIVHGTPEGGYTDAYELICCECGDDPDLDYREISPELQRIRGPYKIAIGVTAYEQHVRRHKNGGRFTTYDVPNPRSRERG